ncbi:MAG: ethanolamine ammonia-lyase subunit EutB [Intestinimonas sp.]
MKKIYAQIRNWTVSELREWILDEERRRGHPAHLPGLTSEMVAAVAKLMSNMDLIYAARKLRVTATCNTTIGEPGTSPPASSSNHPTDDPTASWPPAGGLTFGIGDAVLGLNPVDDSVESVTRVLERFHEIRNRWEIPTQICVLAHVTTQMECVRRGAPADLIFQSIAGSEKGNEAFGFTGETIEEARQLALREGNAMGPNVLYFETGQGSELSSEAHNGWDQVTMEARCYGFAKRYQPFLVNTVVGFIGPEYLYNSKQVIRAGLEDHFMGKLTGIPMGCDACYTNHMKADQSDIEDLAVLLTTAGCNYFMGIPHGDDVMLNYQTTGYHETAALREMFGLTAIKPFQQWLEKMGFVENGRLTALQETAPFCWHKEDFRFERAGIARLGGAHGGRPDGSGAYAPSQGGGLWPPGTGQESGSRGEMLPDITEVDLRRQVPDAQSAEWPRLSGPEA